MTVLDPWPSNMTVLEERLKRPQDRSWVRFERHAEFVKAIEGLERSGKQDDADKIASRISQFERDWKGCAGGAELASQYRYHPLGCASPGWHRLSEIYVMGSNGYRVHLGLIPSDPPIMLLMDVYKKDQQAQKKRIKRDCQRLLGRWREEEHAYCRFQS